MKRVLGIAEMAVSQDPADVLITYALGPCLGVAIYDPAVRVGGLIHCQLPTAKGNQDWTEKNPLQFVDTGIEMMLTEMFECGAEKRRLIVMAAGAAKCMDNLDRFQIAERNFTIFRKLMWKNSILIHAAEVGGDRPRNMSLEIGTGRVVLQSCGQEWELQSSQGIRVASTGLPA